MNAVMTVYCSDHQGNTCKASNDYLVPVHKSLMNIVHVLMMHDAWPCSCGYSNEQNNISALGRLGFPCKL